MVCGAALHLLAYRKYFHPRVQPIYNNWCYIYSQTTLKKFHNLKLKHLLHLKKMLDLSCDTVHLKIYYLHGKRSRCKKEKNIFTFKILTLKRRVVVHVGRRCVYYCTLFQKVLSLYSSMLCRAYYRYVMYTVRKTIQISAI